MKALVIEDDPETTEYIRLVLRTSWPEITMVSTCLGERGVEMVTKESPDVVLLDLGLPDIDGCEVLKRIHSYSSVPVIITSVRKSDEEIRDGLELGADAYLVKPFEPRELIDNLKAVTSENSRPHIDKYKE
jgi:two-component system KDP operon response regulator KdpE